MLIIIFAAVAIAVVLGGAWLRRAVVPVVVAYRLGVVMASRASDRR
jgi:hypothetical protein